MARGPGISANYEESDLGKVLDKRLVARLWPYIQPYRHLVALAIFLAMISSALQLASPIITRRIIDSYLPITTHEAQKAVGVFCLLYLAVLVLVFASNFVLIYITQWVGQRGLYSLRRDLFEKLNALSLSYFDRTPSGRILTRTTSDVNVLNDLFAQGIVHIFADFIKLFGIVGLWFWYEPWLGVLLFFISPIMVLAAYNFRIRARSAYRSVRTNLSVLNSFLAESLTGVSTVQAYNREEHSQKRYNKMNGAYRDAQIDTVRQYAQFFPLVEIVRIVAICLVFGFAGLVVKQVLFKDYAPLTEGDFALYFSLTAMFFMPIRDLAERYNIFQSAMASAERIFVLLDEPIEVMDPSGQEINPTVRDNELPALSQGVELRDAWFAYNDDDWVLRGVSMRVDKGQTVALVGATGAGKSTVINLISRLYDVQKGLVLFDGMDVKTLPQSALRRRMAIVLQDVFLFSGTIADNIRLGNKNITDAQVEQAARYVNAHQFISKLPGGYNQPVLERGATLSTGQKQLLAFARAIAFDPDLLILDEATANIDTETEALIQDALTRILHDRTCIVVAHRLSTIQNSDKIIVFSHGKIHEEGNHQELLQRDGLYRHLYELQYKV